MEIWGEKILEKYGAKFYRILRANLYGELGVAGGECAAQAGDGAEGFAGD